MVGKPLTNEEQFADSQFPITVYQELSLLRRSAAFRIYIPPAVR